MYRQEQTRPSRPCGQRAGVATAVAMAKTRSTVNAVAFLAMALTALIAIGTHPTLAGQRAGQRAELGAESLTPRASSKLWVTADRLRHLARVAPAWSDLDRWADQAQRITLHQRNENADVALLAATYRAIAADDQTRISELRAMVIDSMGTEIGPSRGDGDGETLALARNLPGLLISAKLLGVAERRVDFKNWVASLLNRRIGSQRRSLRSTHEDRANNWGTHAGAARITIAILLGDEAELTKASDVFQGWLGARHVYADFHFGALDWQTNQQTPVGINPAGAKLRGYSVDGVIPDDQRRAGGFRWPPPKTNYNWEALQGAVVQAQLLSDQGRPAWSWGDRAILRAVRWLIDVADHPPTGDDLWMLPLLDAAYGTHFSDAYIHSQDIVAPGKSVGFTQLTHNSALPQTPNLELVAAVLPSSRTLQVGASVTAFATVIATGPASGCRVSLPQAIPGLSLSFRPRDPVLDSWLGNANDTFSLAANEPMQLLLEMSATHAFQPSELAYEFRCAASIVAPSIAALNTLLLAATILPQPDLVFLTTTTRSDGTVAVPVDASYGFFAAAAINLGSTARLTIRADTLGVDATETLICLTNPTTGACYEPPAPTLSVRVEAQEAATFATFVRRSGGVEYSPAHNRLLLQAIDAEGNIRGRGSVALR